MDFMKKYVPKTMNDLVFVDQDSKRRMDQYALGKRSGNIVLHGPKGTAKSTTARMVAESKLKSADSTNPYCVYHAQDISVATIDNMWSAYRWQMLDGVKDPYVVIEEADQLSKSLQQKLRAMVDAVDYGYVILTTNHIHSLDVPLVDRCDDVEMPMANTSAWYPTAANILTAEGIKFTRKQLDALLASGNGSIRDMMRGLEDFVLEQK